MGLVSALVTATVALVTLVPGTPAPAAPAARAEAPAASDPAAAAARVDAARQQADALASRYFAALDRRAALDVQISRLESELARDEQRTHALRSRVAIRASELYMAGDTTVADYLSGTDPLVTERRKHLMAAADATDDAVFGQLQRETEGLRARRKQLRTDRQNQEHAITQLHGAQVTMDAQLALAQRELTAARAAVAATQAAKTRAAAATSGSRASPAATSGASGSGAIATPPLGPPGAPAPSSGGGSHHDDPFLVCTRARESHGDYGVVNPAGPWYGAYQFSQSTWDSVANHAGRVDLIGVRPNAASVADQDAMAWTLYQWQGKGPWGGLC
ncbi:MAG TPA: transglycosylase family protein [Acidimicrobiia bacterium]